MALNKKNIKTNASDVAKTEAEKSEKMLVQNILIENLVPDPNNGEDVSETADLEYSITENGFNDPLVVTSFGMEDGKYRIVSGHRRTEAMKKLGKTAIPCFIHEFNSEEEVANAREAFNLATRDSAKDPMLYVNRWVKFLSEHKSEKVGEVKEKFSKMSGLSAQQVQRLQTTAKLIAPIQIMIREGIVGQSNCEPIAPLDKDKQNDVYIILNEAIADMDESVLTRGNVKKIVDEYKNGAKSWNEIKEKLFPSNVNNSHGENNKEKSNGTNENFDIDEPEKKRNEDVSGENDENDSTYDDADTETETAEEISDDGIDEEELAELKKGKSIIKHIDAISNILTKDFYRFGNEEETAQAIEMMVNLCNELLDKAQEVAEESESKRAREIYRMAYNEHMEKAKKLKD